MSLLFAEYGVEVNFYDPSEENAKSLLKEAEEAKLSDKIKWQKDYESLCNSLGSPKVFVFSLPHGDVGDKTVESLKPYLKAGDVIVDGANEFYLNTQRRQEVCRPLKVHYIGTGVSGGYQSARHGPSLSPSGDDEGLELVMPFLQKIAAKDSKGRPCVAKVGPAGSGHYVKMIHNGIEQGMMSALCETWGILNKCLGMDYEEISSVFHEWSSEGLLKKNFLVSIGADICETRDPKDDTYVLAKVKDKVVQDVDESEGTGIWTCQEGIRLHAATPTITTAHLFRIASADAAQRELAKKSLDGGIAVETIKFSGQEERKAFVEDLRSATFAAFLMSFIQGLDLLEKADVENKWKLNYASIIQIWRAGCIIQADYISDLLEKVYNEGHGDGNLVCNRHVAEYLTKYYPALKKVVLKATEADANIPSLSASLEYVKYSGSTDLPTQFMEAELDYFGSHMFDLKGAGPGRPKTGSHHFEWQPARGIHESK